MAVKKITISLDAELAVEIRRGAEANASTVSAWLAEAARNALRSHYLRLAVDAYEAEHGAFTDEEIEEARRLWQESLSTQEHSSTPIAETSASGVTSASSRTKKAS